MTTTPDAKPRMRYAKHVHDFTIDAPPALGIEDVILAYHWTEVRDVVEAAVPLDDGAFGTWAACGRGMWAYDVYPPGAREPTVSVIVEKTDC